MKRLKRRSYWLYVATKLSLFLLSLLLSGLLGAYLYKGYSDREAARQQQQRARQERLVKKQLPGLDWKSYRPQPKENETGDVYRTFQYKGWWYQIVLVEGKRVVRPCAEAVGRTTKPVEAAIAQGGGRPLMRERQPFIRLVSAVAPVRAVGLAEEAPCVRNRLP